MLSHDYRGSEMFGEGVLNLGVIAGAVFLLLASLWTCLLYTSPSPRD